ncbi:hypothetical protein Tco_0007969 [Tanacetum coccineum]
MKYDEKTGVYSCQVDEQWFNLSADILRKALDITLVDPAYPFELPPTGDMVIDFVNQLGHEASLKDTKKKAVPLLIPYGRFTKMIIYYLGSTSDVHKRPESPCHLPGDDFRLAINNLCTIHCIWKMFAKNTKKHHKDSASKQPEPATKRAPPKKPTTTTPVKPTKTPSSKHPKSPTKKPSKRKLPQKVRKGKPSFQLVDEDDEAQQESVPQEEGDDPDLELAKKMSLDAHQEKGKEAAAPKGHKELGEVDSSTLSSGVSIPISTQGQAGSDPEKAHEALAGPDPEPMQEDQLDQISGKSLSRIKNLKRVRKRLSKSKGKQGEEKQESTYSNRSTDKVALKEFDLKRKVKDRGFFKANKRKHEHDEEKFDEDDEGSSAGSTRDEGHVSDLEDTDNAHIPKKITGQIHTPQRIKFLREQASKGETCDIWVIHKWFTDKLKEEAFAKLIRRSTFNLVKPFIRTRRLLQYQNG